MKRHAWRRTWRGYLYADAGDVFVFLPLNGQFTAFLGRKGSKYGHPQNYNLNIFASETKKLTEDGEFIGHAIPHDLIDRKTRSLGFNQYSGGGIKQLPGGGINKPYRIVIPFNLSGDNFLVDVLVEVTKDGYWDIKIGAPATP